MKKLIFTLSMLLSFNLISTGQDSHLSLLYDIEGNDFDYAINAMVGTNDSLYVISNTPNGQGVFYRLDENGEGYESVWEFDNVNFAPSSLIANDTIIYGTTRFSSNGGGTIFKYSLKDYSFEFIKNFDPNEAQETQIKYITDSVLWLTSQWSFVDEGSIFIVDKDGTEFTKIYNDTNFEQGQNPVDFVFHEDKIYIACYNGGGNPYPDGTGSTVSSGSIIRINTDGTGYENIVMGGDDKGTQPQSLIIRETKLIGLFAYSGSNSQVGGQFFRSDLDGSSYDSLGALSDRALTRMISTDSLIYGLSGSNIFGINPFDGEIRIFDDLSSNPDFGYDIVANPAFLNGTVFLTAQQGGPNLGGTILKWTNQDPETDESNSGGRMYQTMEEINLNELFVDPEGDSLTYDFEFDSSEIEINESNGILEVTLLGTDEVDLQITANDGWVGYKSITYTYNGDSKIITGIADEFTENLVLYPNPALSKLYLNIKNIELVEVLTLKGELLLSLSNPENEINISSLGSGIYLVRYIIEGKSSVQKIIKR